MARTFNEIRKDLARNLKTARLEVGLSQEALALEANVDRTYVSQIERGLGNPSVCVIAKLSAVVKKDFCYFFNED